MHIFLLGVFPDYGIGDGIYGAAKLIQLGKLALNLQLFLDALTGYRVEFLFQFRIFCGQLLVGLVILFSLVLMASTPGTYLSSSVSNSSALDFLLKGLLSFRIAMI